MQRNRLDLFNIGLIVANFVLGLVFPHTINSTWLLVSTAPLIWVLYRRSDNQFLGIVALLVGYSFLSIFWSYSPTAIHSFVPLLYALLVFLFANSLGSRRLSVWLHHVLVLSAIIVSFVSIVMYFLGGEQRLSLLNLPINVSSGILAAVLVYLVVGLLIGRRLGPNWLHYIYVAVILLATILTYSRGAIILLLLFGLGYLFHWFVRLPNKHRPMLLLVLCGLLIAISLLATSNPIRYGYVRNTSVTTNDRREYVVAGIKSWWQRPIFGSGIGSYAYVGLSEQTAVVVPSKNSHTAFITYLVELGIVGSALWLIFLIKLGRVIRHRLTTNLLVAPFIYLLLHFYIDMDAAFLSAMIFLAIAGGHASQTLAEKAD